MEAIERLRNRFLKVPLASVVHPASLSAQRAAAEQQIADTAAPASKDIELTAQQLVKRGLTALHSDEELSFYTEAIRVNPDYAAGSFARSARQLGPARIMQRPSRTGAIFIAKQVTSKQRSRIMPKLFGSDPKTLVH